MKLALTVPDWPSVTVTSLTERDGEPVVVDDRAHGLGVGDRGVGGAREVEEEALGDLVEQVAVDEHDRLLRGLAGREGQRPRARVKSAGAIAEPLAVA